MDLAKSIAARLYDLNYDGKLEMSHEAWMEAAVDSLTPLKRAKVEGFGMEVRGGCVVNAWSEVQCESCGDIVYPPDGYDLQDYDVEDSDSQ